MPIDNGHLILSEGDYLALRSDKSTIKLVRSYTGGDEFINNTKRYCLWLDGADYTESEFAKERVKLVSEFRRSSGRATTVSLAETPHLFGEIRQPKVKYLLLPKVSSERRGILPIGFLPQDIIASGSALIVPGAGKFEFGVLSSTMHMAWMRTVCGRLESRYQYSSSLVYNNYPWPKSPTKAQIKAIEDAAQGILDARAVHEGKTNLDDGKGKGKTCAYSLAWAYNPETMPLNLRDAHDELDQAIDEAYGYEYGNEDAQRVAFLFRLYQQYTTLLPAEEGTPEPRKSTKAKRKTG